MTATPWFKVGLRVEDVQAAGSFYGGLGFDRIGAVPNEGGKPPSSWSSRRRWFGRPES